MTSKPRKPDRPKPQRERAQRAPRVSFDYRVTVKIEHPGATVVTLELQARDLSRTGLRVQHINFIYPGSPVTITFLRGKKPLVTTYGRVARCEYVGSSRHDVGIAFENPLDAEDLTLLTPAGS